MKIALVVGVVLAAALIAVVSVLTGGTVTNHKKDVLTTSALVGRHMKSWTLNGLDGGTVRAPWSAGHPSVLVFFGSFCGPCKSEMPKLAAYLRTHNTGSVDVVAMDADDKRAPALAMVKKDDVTVPVAFDPDGAVTTNIFGFEAVPESVFLSAKGVVKGVYYGAIPESVFVQGLKLLRTT
ncbi:MAG TPA: TlpA disulfide reductase family protein [Acidimicrobiales bacterium]|nr:TlpA disulfide reductase family protein [Acidimicrobiales bacterium]